jgi:osmotically-inducible protein OsmY
MKYLKICSTFLLTISMLVAIGCASTTTESSTGEMIDDTVITTKVKAAIFQDEELSSSEISVETFKGVVQLSGFVSDRSDVPRAAVVARGVAGVVSVKNSLVVK